MYKLLLPMILAAQLTTACQHDKIRQYHTNDRINYVGFDKLNNKDVSYTIHTLIVLKEYDDSSINNDLKLVKFINRIINQVKRDIKSKVKAVNVYDIIKSLFTDYIMFNDEDLFFSFYRNHDDKSIVINVVTKKIISSKLLAMYCSSYVLSEDMEATIKLLTVD